MLTEQQQRMLRKHAIDRMQQSVQHAQDWVDFYTDYGPATSLTQWENTLLYRLSLLKVAIEHDAEFARVAESADAEDATTTA